MASSDGRNPNPQSNLHQQDLSKLDITKLSALSPEVISRQATINIGTIGHVAHGKSTVVKAISGVQTVRFKNELERNITIKLERVSDSLIRMYRERADERNENTFFEKQKRLKKRALSPESDNNSPPRKKHKKIEPEEFIVESICDYKFYSGTEHFYVKWKGYPDSENTWEPLGNLNNCTEVLTEFVSKQEQKHFNTLELIKQEISFLDLTSEENIMKRLKEIDDISIIDLKIKLVIKLLSIMNLDPSEEDYVTPLIQDTRNILQLYTLSRKRCRQLMALKDWEDHLNQVDKCKKISIENTADLAGPPQNFTYINHSIPGQGVIIPDNPPIGCDCTLCNCRSKSCCGMQDGLFAYTANKRLRVAPGTPIYECNKACKCPPECNNRIVQSGRSVKLCIYRTANGCGWGVKTEKKIFQGQFVCQYVGEVITHEEAEKRGREYDVNGLTYLFDLDFNSIENPYTVDAAYHGNISHFINHSCDPNLGVWAVWADCLDPNLPMLALFATRDIEAGEEICFDYMQKMGDDDNGSGSNLTPNSSIAASTDCNGDISDEPDVAPGTPSTLLQNGRRHLNQTECKCGAINCRKYLF